MNRGWLLVGGVSAALLVGAAIWVADAEAPEDDTQELHGEEAEVDEGRRPRDRERRQGKSASAMRRIEALEEQVADLQREIKTLRAAAGLSARVAEAQSDDDPESDDPVFEGAVREIIENDRKEEREAEVERRRERVNEAIDTSATELADKAGLGAEQREGIASLWKAEADAVMPLWIGLRSGERSWSETREEIEKIRMETDAEAKKLVGEEHHELYDELRPRGRERDRDRDRDRDGGGRPQ
jgi:signal transduction histidine kinase